MKKGAYWYNGSIWNLLHYYNYYTAVRTKPRSRTEAEANSFTENPSVEHNPFSHCFFSDWILLSLLLIASRVEFMVFCALSGDGWCEGVLMLKIGWKLCTSCVLLEQRALRARRILVHVGWWRWA